MVWRRAAGLKAIAAQSPTAGKSAFEPAALRKFPDTSAVNSPRSQTRSQAIRCSAITLAGSRPRRAKGLNASSSRGVQPRSFSVGAAR